MTHPIVVIRQPGCTPIHLQVREPIEVGRECTGVILCDPRVSRRHLVLAPTDRGGPAEVAVLDLGSMNGTLLAGVRLTSEAVLRPGNEVRLGDTTIGLVLELAKPPKPVASVPSVPVAPDAATTVLPASRPVEPVAHVTPHDPWSRPADAGRPRVDDPTVDRVAAGGWHPDESAGDRAAGAPAADHAADHVDGHADELAEQEPETAAESLGDDWQSEAGLEDSWG